MTPSRNKPGVAFWATMVVVVALVVYPLVLDLHFGLRTKIYRSGPSMRSASSMPR